MAEDGLLTETIFSALTKKPAGDSILAEAYAMFFEDVADGSATTMLVLADWLDDNDRVELAEAIRYELSPARIRQHFADLAHCGEPLHYQRHGFYEKTRLAVAREVALKTAIGLLPGWAEKRSMRAITNFTRTKMREDGFYRRIMSAVTAVDGISLDGDKPVKVVDHG